MNIQVIDITDPLWQKTLGQLHHDIYHLPEYLELEAKRTKSMPQGILITEGENIFFLPYLLRKCDEILFAYSSELRSQLEIFDIVSPYGYPGILLSESATKSPDFLQVAMLELISTLSAKNICSAFLRLHPILNQELNKIYGSDIFQITGETVAVNLNLSHEEIWSQTRSDHRKDINRHKLSGLTANMVLFSEYFDEFLDIYHQTMDRLDAKQLYYFTHEYFSYLLNNLNNYLHLGIVKFENKIISACLFTECSGIVHSHLSGTKNEFLKLSPDKLLFDHVRYWAKERGNKILHLGGGYGGAKDGVFNFKAGFSKERYSFMTMRLILHQEQYDYLVKIRAKSLNTNLENLLNSNFFPAYRAEPINDK